MTSTSHAFFPEHHRPGLFRSRAWLNTWAQHWGHGANIMPLANSPELAEHKLYRLRQMLKGVIPIQIGFPAGVSTSATPSVRSEYFFFSQKEEKSAQVIADYLNQLQRQRWDQFLLPDLLRSSNEYPLLLDQARAANLKVVEKHCDKTYGIDLTDKSFEQYLGSLGKNTRLKLFNRRKNLASLGTIKLENIWPDQDRFYQLLNEFHRTRWNKPCYQGIQLQFISDLSQALADDGHEIDFSVLSVNDEVVSVLFDVRVNGRQYNFQSGYLENFARNISLGTLHLGYQIEAAFSNPGIGFYDFMAGTGKNSDYKSAIANTSDELVTLALVRNPLLKFAYSWHALQRSDV